LQVSAYVLYPTLADHDMSGFLYYQMGFNEPQRWRVRSITVFTFRNEIELTLFYLGLSFRPVRLVDWPRQAEN
jgi:hypothetical protein